MNKIKMIHEFLANILFPDGFKCVNCGREIDKESNKFSLCENCFSKINNISGKVCLKCGEPLFSVAKYCLRCKKTSFSFEHAFSYCIYSGLIRHLIQEFKFSNKTYLSKSFGYMLYVTYLMEIMPKYHIDCVTYVPIHSSRLKQRGYNQCELIAREFCKNSKLKLYKNVLVKTKHTKQQVGLSSSERKINLKNAFEVIDKYAVKNKTFLLIDDIFTTGSTCDECASALMKAGAYKVIVLTVAHTQLNSAVIKKVNKKWKLLRLFQTKDYATHI